MKKIFASFILAISLFSFAANAEVKEYKIVIKDHKFTPKNLEVPANEKIKLIVENQDKTIEEFESYDLNREKIVNGGKSIIIYFGPLKAGTYQYYGEFNKDSAQGSIIAK